MLQHLRTQNATPTSIVSENFAKIKTTPYVNYIGREDVNHNILGTGYLLLKEWLPEIYN